jgi:dTDP-4-dehydrorhamnose reductase
MNEGSSTTGSGTTQNRALLLGATSVIGFTLARDFAEYVVPVANPHNRAADGRAWHRARLDEPAEWLSLLQAQPPDVIIYAHAVCDVGKCQQHPLWARQMNVDCLASVLAHVPASTRVVYVSSDHVFGGDGTYSESSAPTPISVYGETRVAAERLVRARPGSLIVRCGLPIGPSLNGRAGFYDWLRYRYERHLPITVIRDEWRSAAWAGDIARRIFAMAQAPLTGARHIAATRAVARPELATFLMHGQGLPAQFSVRDRAEQAHPHLGRVELVSDYDDNLATPLVSVIPTS